MEMDMEIVDIYPTDPTVAFPLESVTSRVLKLTYIR